MEASKLKFKLIIGLGNPDSRYQNTYHNVGQLFIDYLNSDAKLRMHPNLQILKSDIYMNESGQFVKKALKKSGLKPETLLVVHDDSDLTLGSHKLQFGRGAAGHHGVENIQATLKTKNFWRLRIGVRPKQKEGMPRLKAEKFVLKKITGADKKIITEVFQRAVSEIND